MEDKELNQSPAPFSDWKDCSADFAEIEQGIGGSEGFEPSPEEQVNEGYDEFERLDGGADFVAEYEADVNESAREQTQIPEADAGFKPCGEEARAQTEPQPEPAQQYNGVFAQNQQYYGQSPNYQYPNGQFPYNQNGYAPGAYPPPTGYGYYYPQPPVKKEKMKTSVKLLIVLCSVLMGAALIGFFVNFAMNIDRNFVGSIFDEQTPSLPNFSEENPFEYEDDPSEEQIDESEPPTVSPELLRADFTLELVDNSTADNEKESAINAYPKVSASTVGVIVSDKENVGIEKAVSQGSGIVLTADGYILTNSHVIENSRKLFCTVITAEGSEYPAKIVGYDSRVDLAVLKITEDVSLVPATFADSDRLSVGETVIAVGNPGGITFQNSLSKGIVSAVGRAASSNTSVKYIQTDAAINPGNSGGPLANLSGQVVGVNTIKISSTSYEGMGFAIPSRTVKSIAEEIIKNGYVSGRVRVGFVGKPITSERAERYGVSGGIEIFEISEYGPLAQSQDVKIGDILIKLDGENVKNFSEVFELLELHSPGDTVELTLLRLKGSSTEEYTVVITLQEDVN